MRRSNQMSNSADSIPRTLGDPSRTGISIPGSQVAFPGQEFQSPAVRWRFPDKISFPRTRGEGGEPRGMPVLSGEWVLTSHPIMKTPSTDR